MILLSITTATMLALVVEQRRRLMGKASVALVVRKGFVNRFGRPFGPARSFLIFRPPAGSPDGNFSCLRGFSSPLSISLSACPIDASDKAGGKWCLMVPVDCAAVAWNRAGASTGGAGARHDTRCLVAGAARTNQPRPNRPLCDRCVHQQADRISQSGAFSNVQHLQSVGGRRGFEAGR